MQITIFDTVSAQTAQAIQVTWPQLVDRCNTMPSYPTKNSCPLVKLAKFGGECTAAGALRHDKNVMAVCGLEADYDAEVVPADSAAAMLQFAGIEAFIYTSPSHTPSAPRWRVLAPLSRDHVPADRRDLVARLNGALGGILAPESFTLSQAFYFGRVQGATFETYQSTGHCIDLVPDLPSIYPVAGGAAHAAKPVERREATPEMIADLRSALVAIPADDRVNWVSVGQALVGLGDTGFMLWMEWSAKSVKHDAANDWKQWASFTGDRTGHAAVFAKAQALGWVNPRRGADLSQVFESMVSDTSLERPSMLKPVSVSDVLTNPAPPPQFIWDGYLPCGVVSLLGAHGGTGKSTIALMLGVCTALGRPLFGINTVQCKTLFVSLEDSAHIVRHRLAFICRTWGINPGDLQDKMHIVDGTESPELFSADSRGAGETTATYFELRKLVQSEGVGLVVVDNASDAYGGDEIQRRQVRAFIRALAEVSRLTGCAMLLLAHVDKNTSKARKAEGGEGYSGSTAWHNSARSRLFMTRTEMGTLTLEHQKSNLGKLREVLALVWPENGLPQLGNPATGFLDSVQGRGDDDRATILLKMIAEFESRQQYCSTGITSRNHVYAVLKSEPSFHLLKLKQDDVKHIVNQCQRNKWIEPVEYRDNNRKRHQRWTLTTEGRAVAGLIAPTAPSAPTYKDGAPSAECADSAPTAPTGIGGVGEKRTSLRGRNA